MIYVKEEMCMKKISKKSKAMIIGILLIAIFCCSLILEKSQNNGIFTNAETGLSNTKIEWGIKRSENNEQPDVGSKNKELISKYNGK